MKNWQQRWFVLRGDQLFYYKDKDESKPQVRHEGPGCHGCYAEIRAAEFNVCMEGRRVIKFLTPCVFPYHSSFF